MFLSLEKSCDPITDWTVTRLRHPIEKEALPVKSAAAGGKDSAHMGVKATGRLC